MTTPRVLFAILKSECEDFDPQAKTIDLEDLPYGSELICPICQHPSLAEDSFLIDDYVDAPMIWDGSGTLTANCGARCVLLEKTARILTLQEAKNEFPDCENIIDQWVSPPGDIFDIFLSVDCAKIKRIANRQLYRYKLPDGVRDLTDREVFDFVAGQEHASQEHNDLTARLNIVENDKNDDPDDSDNEMDMEELNFFRLSLPVDSYDACTPKIPYPANMDLSHDSISIFLLCEDENGKEFPTFFSGG